MLHDVLPAAVRAAATWHLRAPRGTDSHTRRLLAARHLNPSPLYAPPGPLLRPGAFKRPPSRPYQAAPLLALNTEVAGVATMQILQRAINFETHTSNWILLAYFMELVVKPVILRCRPFLFSSRIRDLPLLAPSLFSLLPPTHSARHAGNCAVVHTIGGDTQRSGTDIQGHQYGGARRDGVWRAGGQRGSRRRRWR